VVDFLLVQNYDPATIITGIGPAWSLAVEAVFYLLLPVLAAGALRLTRRTGGRNVVVCTLLPAALLLVTGLATHIALGDGLTERIGRWGTVAAYSFPAQADYFSFGMAAAVIHVVMTHRRMSVASGVRAVAALAAIATIAATVYFAPPDVNSAQAAGWDTLVAAACATLLLVICLPGTGRRRLLGVLEWRPLVGVGLASYSVYLWHTPVIFLLRRWGVTSHGWLSLLPCFAVTLAVTLALSALTYRFVEKSTLARRRSGGGGLAQLEAAAAVP
jgi:peptidoglycan/LPS O-acetylase OafA/YrhL